MCMMSKNLFHPGNWLLTSCFNIQAFTLRKSRRSSRSGCRPRDHVICIHVQDSSPWKTKISYLSKLPEMHFNAQSWHRITQEPTYTHYASTLCVEPRPPHIIINWFTFHDMNKVTILRSGFPSSSSSSSLILFRVKLMQKLSFFRGTFLPILYCYFLSSSSSPTSLNALMTMTGMG